MNETIVENYHGCKIEGKRISPTMGDYEQWTFWVTEKDTRIFSLTMKLSRTQKSIMGKNDEQASLYLRDRGLRRAHGKIDLLQYQVGESTEFLIDSNPVEEIELCESKIKRKILAVLERVWRNNPAPERMQIAYFDAYGFSELLGIPHSAYVASASMLLADDYVAQTKLEQKTLDNGGIYITPTGIRHYRTLEKQANNKFLSARVYVDIIDSFVAVRDVAPSDVHDMLSSTGYLDYCEDDIQHAFEQILSERFHQKDWGGELNDLYTGNVVLNRNRVATAFLLKGNGLRKSEMQIADCGKNGDQIVRLFQTPAELFVIQFVGEISQNVISDVEGKIAAKRSQGIDAHYCIINGQDTARLLRAYGKEKK